jgi:uncharacterized repeat protein (TIGR03803 family)
MAVLLAWACMPTPVRGQGLTSLASFNGTNGAQPGAGVIFDASGNLFGTTRNGGGANHGVVWELAKGTSTITPLASFNGTNGGGAGSPVTFDANGNLFGTAQIGGANGFGTVWELAKGSSTITLLASFDGTNGRNPLSGVTFDANGNLFGTATVGGLSNNGTVWELAKGSSAITALASFNGANGNSPSGAVTFDANGNLFGTAETGGTSNMGTVWELAKGSSTITALASLNGTNGTRPTGGATFDANGNLFGTAETGGLSNNGTVWELAKGSSTIVPLASFNGTNGFDPFSGVTFDANGNLVGTAQLGGLSGNGTVWELAKGSSTITPLASFNGTTNGGVPGAGVTFDANGNLFGTTLGGGSSSFGTVWELSSIPEPSPLVLGLISCALAGAAALFKQHRRSCQDRVLKTARSS